VTSLKLVSEFLTLVPHRELVATVHQDCFLIKPRVLDGQLLKKHNRETLSTFASGLPDLFEVALIAEVLSDCDCEIKVKDTVPPASRHVHRLAWPLYAFYDFRKFSCASHALFLFESWQQNVKVLNSFVIFTLESKMFSSDKRLSNAWTRSEQNPSFTALNRRVPRTGQQRIYVHLAT
jgi:hypothetical protein